MNCPSRVLITVLWLSAAAFAQPPATTRLGGGEGWTDLRPAADSRLVYVSSSAGRDVYNGLSPDRPVRSIAHAKQIIRQDHPDWLMLKCGDTWTESLGHWVFSGRSETEPMVITSYGQGPRPMLRTGSENGITVTGGGGTPPTTGHLAIVGLHFLADTYDGKGDCAGVQWLRPGENLLIEDCLIEGYGTNLVIQPEGQGLRNFALRRCVVVDAWHHASAHSQGIYAENVHEMLLEENLFDHNGWRADTPGAEATIFNHNLYLNSGNSGVILRRNLIANAASHGAQVRPGGIVNANLFVGNPIGLLVGSGDGQVRGNVILEGGDIGADKPRGFGIDIGAVKRTVIANNIIAHDKSAKPYGHAIQMGRTGEVILQDNVIHAWRGGIVRGEKTAEPPAGAYVDPDRSVASYSQSLGKPATLAAFLAEARQQSKQNWRNEYTAGAVIAYIRQGFSPARP